MDLCAFIAALLADWVARMGTAGSLFFLIWGLITKKPLSRKLVFIVSAILFFASCVGIWTVEHRARLNAEARPNLVFDYKTERKVYLQAPEDREGIYRTGNQWRINIRVITDRPVDDANVYVTRLSKVGDPNFNITDKQKIGWDRGKESFLPQTLTGTDLQIIPFLANDDGKTLNLFTDPDNTLAEYNDAKPLRPGTYHMTLQVEGTAEGHRVIYKQCYLLFWDGSLRDYPTHFHMDPLPDGKVSS